MVSSNQVSKSWLVVVVSRLPVSLLALRLCLSVLEPSQTFSPLTSVP